MPLWVSSSNHISRQQRNRQLSHQEAAAHQYLPWLTILGRDMIVNRKVLWMPTASPFSFRKLVWNSFSCTTKWNSKDHMLKPWANMKTNLSLFNNSAMQLRNKLWLIFTKTGNQSTTWEWYMIAWIIIHPTIKGHLSRSISIRRIYYRLL
jgi:hypothetical protein